MGRRLAKSKYRYTPPFGDKVPYLEEILLRNGSHLGLDAFSELCDLGCDKETLGAFFAIYGSHDEIRIKPTNRTKGRVISTRPLDSFETAFRPFNATSMRDLESLVERTKEFLKDIDLLKRSAVVQELIERELIRDGDILAGPFLLTGPFYSLLNLPELIKKLDLGRHPDQTRLRKFIHSHIFERTGRWHDDLVADVFNHLPLFENKPTTSKAVKMWRKRHGCNTPRK
jgi:hypothetical protein